MTRFTCFVHVQDLVAPLPLQEEEQTYKIFGPIARQSSAFGTISKRQGSEPSIMLHKALQWPSVVLTSLDATFLLTVGSFLFTKMSAFITLFNSQKYHRCNQFHYSHVINSGELQDCNWNCNCKVINLSDSNLFLGNREPVRQHITVMGQLRSANSFRGIL